MILQEEGAAGTARVGDLASKVCRGPCGQDRLLTAFAADSKAKDGHKGKCRDCTSQADAQRKSAPKKPKPKPKAKPKAPRAPKKVARKSAPKKVARKSAPKKVARKSAPKKVKTRTQATGVVAGRNVNGDKRKNKIPEVFRRSLEELFHFLSVKPRTSHDIQVKFGIAKPTAYVRIASLRSLGAQVLDDVAIRQSKTGPESATWTATGKLPEALKKPGKVAA